MNVESLPATDPPTATAPPRRANAVRVLAAVLCGVLIAMGLLRCYSPKVLPRSLRRAVTPWLGPVTWERPYGMAPEAFKGYLAACAETGISPAHIGQTIGDAVRSVGYHKRDGFLEAGGGRVPYTTAVDIGTGDLNDRQIARFVRQLGRHGFAAWYRHGPHWRNGEHIHAVWASLPMKPQLQTQVLQ